MAGKLIGSRGEPTILTVINGHSIKLTYKVVCQYPCTLWIALRLHQRSFFVLWLVVEEEACDWSKYRAQGTSVSGVYSHTLDMILTPYPLQCLWTIMERV